MGEAARGRSERIFGTLPGRLPRELAEAGIRDIDTANRFLRETFVPAFNRRFAVEAEVADTAFVPLLGTALDDIHRAPEEHAHGGS